jgi:hypothetical protein
MVEGGPARNLGRDIPQGFVPRRRRLHLVRLVLAVTSRRALGFVRVGVAVRLLGVRFGVGFPGHSLLRQELSFC